jgi:nitrogen regulation protein NR(I)
LGKILIVDDDPQLRTSFEKVLTGEGHTVQSVASGEKGLDLCQKSLPDLVILDIRLPGIDGLQTFKAIHEIEPKLPAIIMTAYGTTDTAIEATKLGAFDYVLKPFEIPDMLSLIDKALEAGRFMRSRVEMDKIPEDASTPTILGRSDAMQAVYKAIGRVASTDATVLVRGDSGTGKELVARAIYQHSPRSDRPFVVVNCVAIPETLLESELFGYEKGAFTGATSRKIGKIEQSHGGTVFLDEIGDMPFSVQAKILRLLQEKIVERLGGRAPINVDVRVIAATNVDLETALSEGRFREDLYYRLKVVTINLPPLRERGDDIDLLSEYFLRKCASELGVPYPGFTAEAKSVLRGYNWPGNVRELANAVQRALIFSRGSPIAGDEMTQAVSGERTQVHPIEQPEEDSVRQWVKRVLALSNSDKIFMELADRFAEMIIEEALNQTGGNRSHAAKLLGLSRPTLLAKMEKYDIRTQTAVKHD